MKWIFNKNLLDKKDKKHLTERLSSSCGGCNDILKKLEKMGVI